MNARNVVIILVGIVLWTRLSYLFLVVAVPLLFGIPAYNDPMSIVTKIELTGTEKLFT